MKQVTQYTLLLVLGLSTPGVLADDSGEESSRSSQSPVSRGPQAPGWDRYHSAPDTPDLPTVLEYYRSRKYLLAAFEDMETSDNMVEEEFKRHWTFRRRLFRYHFAPSKQLGIGYYKDADIKGFTTTVLVEWDGPR